MKQSPFDINNKGEEVDKNFFARLIRLEEYFNQNSTDEIFVMSFEAMKKINKILQESLLSLDDIRAAIDIYNEYNYVFRKNKSTWYDLRLHLRHLAFVYGEEYETDNDLRLIVKS